MVVFDAYRLEGHQEEVIDYQNIRMVYTKEAQTADQFIEKFAHDHIKKYNIIVATSDGLQQIIVRGAGCSLLSARELKLEIELANEKMHQDFQGKIEKSRNFLMDTLSVEERKKMEDMIKKE